MSIIDNLLQAEEQKDYRQYYKKIAEEIGEETEAIEQMVREVVELSNKHKVMYHGIKDSRSVESINKNGLAPITPESFGNGPASFWSTGLALFEPDIDSPFFNYSGGSSRENPSVCELNLAMARYDPLAMRGVELTPYENDYQVNAYSAVPSDEIELIKVRLSHPAYDDDKAARKCRQVCELELLGAIYQKLLEYEGEAALQEELEQETGPEASKSSLMFMQYIMEEQH
jgi:hypothetical protein